MANSHPFNFEGGVELSRMSATWFVSYAYFELVDCNHLSWKNIKTYSSRKSVYYNTRGYHKFWLSQILNMNKSRLNTNKIGVDANETKRMAEIVLNKIS